MSLTSDISNIVAAKYPDATFWLNSWMKANRKSLDLEIANLSVGAPLIVLQNDIKINSQLQQNYNILRNHRIVMRFLVKGDVYDNDSPEMFDDIEAMRDIADTIYTQITMLSGVRILSNNKFEWDTSEVHKSWGSVLNGVEADGRFKYNKIVNLCPTSGKTDDFISTDIPGVDIDDSFIPEEDTVIKE